MVFSMTHKLDKCSFHANSVDPQCKFCGYCTVVFHLQQNQLPAALSHHGKICMQNLPYRWNLHSGTAEFAWRSSEILHGRNIYIILGMFTIKFEKATTIYCYHCIADSKKHFSFLFLWINFT